MSKVLHRLGEPVTTGERETMSQTHYVQGHLHVGHVCVDALCPDAGTEHGHTTKLPPQPSFRVWLGVSKLFGAG